MALYSAGLSVHTGTITNQNLSSTLSELRALTGGDPLIILEWDAERIAVPVSLDVTLPPLGNFKGVDIKENEPILLVFDPVKYPSVAPKAFPDRLDFPKDQLSHLYIANGGKPPGFCLVRDGFDEWYANKTIADLVTRITNWFRDAAAGVLNEDGNQFEPFRLEGYNGTLVYDYDALTKIVEIDAAEEVEQNFATLLFEHYNTTNGDWGWKFIKQVTDANFEEVNQKVQAEADKSSEDKNRKCLFYGFVVWSKDRTVIDSYKITIPKTWQEFVQFCSSCNIDLEPLNKYIVAFDAHRYKAIPIAIAIRRPKPIIGYASPIELLNFHLYIDDGQKDANSINGDAVVTLKQHRQPITIKKASEISGFQCETSTLSILAGCGALGARVGMHLVKSGTANIIASDVDKLSPHNFIRHPLSSFYLDIPKASAFAVEMNKVVTDGSIAASGKNANEVIDILAGTVGNMNILDFTASENFQNFLVNHNGIVDSRICSGSITDFGNLSIVLFEGKNRNPRLDDLYSQLHYLSISDSRIHQWLTHEVENLAKTQNINIGVGCNSETTILSEDVVAGHASFISGNIKQQLNEAHSQTGKVFINEVVWKPYFQFKGSSFEFSPLEIFQIENNLIWQVRMVKAVADKIRRLTASASPKETGGVLIGRANYKTSTLHVVDILDAPPDSKATEVCFHRGIQGLPDEIDKISMKTGNQIGYIGEWHSHPLGPDGWSAKDIATLNRFRSEYNTLPSKFPAFMLIATGNRFIPYLL